MNSNLQIELRISNKQQNKQDTFNEFLLAHYLISDIHFVKFINATDTIIS